MPIHLTDATVNSQRLAIDNNGNVELGSAVPSSSLSVSGRAILNGSSLSQSIVTPGALIRISGSVFIPASSTVNVSCAPCVGFGSAGAFFGCIVGFGALPNGDKIQFTMANQTTLSNTYTYSVI